MIDSVTANEISNKYYKNVYLHCLFLVEDEYEAQDITQNAFLLFQEKCETLEDENIKAWLYKVVDNLAKAYFRTHKKKATVELSENDAVVDDILEYIEREYPLTPREIEEKKQIIFESLSERELKILKMHTEEKKTYKQIAEELNMSEKAVNVCSCRTRKKVTEMAKTLTPHWILLLIKIFF